MILNRKYFLYQIIFLLIFSAVLFGNSITGQLEKAGEAYFNKYRDKGKDKGLEKSIKILENLYNKNKDNPALKVLLGRLYIEKSYTKYFCWTKKKWVKKGMKLQKEAVDAASDDLFILYEASQDGTFLPSFLGYNDESIKRLKKLIKLIKNNKYSLNKQYRNQINAIYLVEDNYDSKKDRDIYFLQGSYYFLGKAYYRKQKYKLSQKFMKKVISLKNNSYYSTSARFWLRIHDYKPGLF